MLVRAPLLSKKVRGYVQNGGHAYCYRKEKKFASIVSLRSSKTIYCQLMFLRKLADNGEVNLAETSPSLL